MVYCSFNMCQTEKYGKSSSQDLPELFYSFFLLAREKKRRQPSVWTTKRTNNIPFFQYINKAGFRACVKELYEEKYDPVSVTYIVLSGKSSPEQKASVFPFPFVSAKKKQKITKMFEVYKGRTTRKIMGRRGDGAKYKENIRARENKI